MLPDGLPGGFKLGETVFYLGEDDQWEDGDSISYGEKGEVTGSVVEDARTLTLSLSLSLTLSLSLSMGLTLALTLTRWSRTCTSTLPSSCCWWPSRA